MITAADPSALAHDEGLKCVLGSPLNNPRLLKAALEQLTAAGGEIGDASLGEFPSPAPSFFFDPDFYMAANPDVVASGVHPYLHFIVHGVGEGRDPHPLIDLDFIRQRLAGGDARPTLTLPTLARILLNNEIPPHPAFDTEYYLANNPDVRDAGISALQHYIEYGAREGRLANPAFDYAQAIAEDGDAPVDRYAAFLRHAARHAAADPRGGDGILSSTEPEDTGDRPESGSALGSAPQAEPQPQPQPEPKPDVAAPEASRATGRSPGGAALVQASGADAPAVEPLETTSGPAAPIVAVEGSFDAIRAGMAFGWAYCRTEPDALLVVEVVCDGRVVGRGTADGYRADLKRAGLGDGHCAFGIHLSRELFDGQSHVLTVRIAGKGQRLHGSQTLAEAAAAMDTGFDMIPARETAQIATQLSSAWADRDAAEEFVAAVVDANLLLELGDMQEALEKFAALAERHADAALLPVKLAEAHLGLGRADLALPLYEQEQPGAVGRLASWRLLGMGNAQRLLGRWEVAAGCYKQGLALEQGLALLSVRINETANRAVLLDARRLLSTGDNAAALKLLASQLLVRPDDVQIHNLVHEADVARAQSPDAEIAAAERSVRLLEVICTHLENHLEGRA